MNKFERMQVLTKVFEKAGFAIAARRLQLWRSKINKFVINQKNHLKLGLFDHITRNASSKDHAQAFCNRCIDYSQQILSKFSVISKKQKLDISS